MFARHLLPFVLISLATVTCIRVGNTMNAVELTKTKLVTAPPLTQLSSQRLQILTLGHKGLYDDLATIWALQFLVDSELKNKSNADEIFNTIHSITKHHTKIEALYLLSCFTLANDFQRADLCDPIFQNGLQAFPNSWRIPLTHAFVASFYLKDDSKAAVLYQLAASKSGVPNHVKDLAARLTARQFVNGQDLNETIDLLKNVPGGTRIIELLREKFLRQEPPPAQEPPHVEP